MTTPRTAESPDEVLALARRWFARELELASKSLGKGWEEHREWVEANLQEELRQRLVARGWRPAHGDELR